MCLIRRFSPVFVVWLSHLVYIESMIDVKIKYIASKENISKSHPAWSDMTIFLITVWLIWVQTCVYKACSDLSWIVSTQECSVYRRDHEVPRCCFGLCGARRGNRQVRKRSARSSFYLRAKPYTFKASGGQNSSCFRLLLPQDPSEEAQVYAWGPERERDPSALPGSSSQIPDQWAGRLCQHVHQ